RSQSAGAAGRRFRGALVVAQLAGSLMLLVVAGLFIRSLNRAEGMFLGFESDHLLTALLDPHQIGYDQVRADGFYRQVEDRLRALPGVRSVSFATALPLEIPGKSNSIYLPGRMLSPQEKPPSISSNSVDSSYFETMRTPLIRGRAFLDSDNEKSAAVAIV